MDFTKFRPAVGPVRWLCCLLATCLVVAVLPLVTVAGPAAAAGEFVTKWDLSKPGSMSRFVALPLVDDGDYDFTVDWGDGQTAQVDAWDDPDASHAYADDGIYTVTITGTIEGWRFNGQGERQRLVEVSAWGPLRLVDVTGDIGGYFRGASNLAITASDTLVLDGITNLSYMFADCTGFTGAGVGGWDIADATDLSGMFESAKVFNADISSWNTGNVTTMAGMFAGAESFNSAIGSWNTGKVQQLGSMFAGATAFNQNLGAWNVTSLMDATNMFGIAGQPADPELSVANYDALLTGWGAQAVHNGVSFSAGNARYSAGGISGRGVLVAKGWAISDAGQTDAFVSRWNTALGSGGSSIALPLIAAGDYDFSVDWGDGSAGQVTSHDDPDRSHVYAAPGTYTVSISGQIEGWKFDGNEMAKKIVEVSKWGPLNFGNQGHAFHGAANLEVTATDPPDLTGVTDLSHTFADCTTLNSDLGNWNTAAVTDMSRMFDNAAAFNQSLSNWDTGNVTTMSRMFNRAAVFNQSLSGWDTGKVTDMSGMFALSGFNQDISQWDTGKVTDMSWMFGSSAFNQPLPTTSGGWNTGSVLDMVSMFNGNTAFDQDISSWDVTALRPFYSSAGAGADTMFWHAGLSVENYGKLLVGWSAQNVKQGVVFDAGSSQYPSSAYKARRHLIRDKKWTIKDSANALPFITTWDTRKSSVAGDKTVQLPLTSNGSYSFTVQWGDGQSSEVTAWNDPDALHVYQTAGEYTVTIVGNLVGWRFAGSSQAEKIVDVAQWGSVQLGNDGSYFQGAKNLTISAQDAPNLANTTNLSQTFAGATALNSDISHWDVESVTNLEGMFSGATSFDQPLAAWDTRKVTNMRSMFAGATAFDQPLPTTENGWNTGKVTTMAFMFNGATSFDQDLGSWDVTSLEQGTGFAMFIGGGMAMFGAPGLEGAVTLSTENYQALLAGWAAQQVKTGVIFSGGSSRYTVVGGVSRATLTGKGWQITDAGPAPYFASKWDTAKPGESGGTSVKLPLVDGGDYDFQVDWGDGTSSHVTAWNDADSTHDYATGGVKEVRIQGRIQGWRFGNQGDKEKLLEITQWGPLRFGNSGGYFHGAKNLVVTAVDEPDLAGVTNLGNAFRDAASFNTDISGWDTSAVTDMSGMFAGAVAFDKPLPTTPGGWSTAGVTTMDHMFDGALAFDQDLGSWNVTALNSAVEMFGTPGSATAAELSPLNYDALLEGWSTQNVTPNVVFGAGNSTYTANGPAALTANSVVQGNSWMGITAGGQSPRVVLASPPKSWNITDAGLAEAMITQWDTTLAGASPAPSIRLPLVQSGQYRFYVDWGDGSNVEEVTSFDQGVHTYPADGQYEVKIVGKIQGWNFSQGGDKEKITGISQWGSVQFGNDGKYFMGARNLRITATGAPKLTGTTNLNLMFSGASKFNTNISSWDTSAVTNMSGMFAGASSYNQPTTFNTANVTTMSNMFSGATSFNQPLAQLNTAKVTDMSGMFYAAINFNQPLPTTVGGWSTSNVTTMIGMFNQALKFNQPIASWDTSKVTSMQTMFFMAIAFNQPLPITSGGWNTSKVTSMIAMFAAAQRFNQPVASWDTSQVTSMAGLFVGAVDFDQPLAEWNTSQVTDMSHMFQSATNFNQPLDSTAGHWDTGKVTSMTEMFSSARKFDQNLGSWNVTSLTDADKMFGSESGDTAALTLTRSNYDALLQGWSSQNVKTVVKFGAGSSEYSLAGQAGHDFLTGTKGWVITDGGLTKPMLMTWDTRKSGVSGNSSIRLPLEEDGVYNFSIDWGDGVVSVVDRWDDPDAAHTYATAGQYMVSIVGPLRGWSFDNNGDQAKLLEISQWGNGFRFGNSGGYFYGASNLRITATNLPNLGGTTNLANMFRDAAAFNSSLQSWNTSAVTNMSGMFAGASSFNQPLATTSGGWNTAAVVTMKDMFAYASAFNQPVVSWQLSNVTDMSGMFAYASAFNQAVSDFATWDLKKLTSAERTFEGALSFNQPVLWPIRDLQNADRMFGMPGEPGAVTLSRDNYDALLYLWGSLVSQGVARAGVKFGAGNSRYGDRGKVDRNLLLAKNWVISDGGIFGAFTSKWDTTKPGVTDNRTIRLPIYAQGTYNYQVDWGDGTRHNGPYVQEHTYAKPGVYTVTISGVINGFNFRNGGDKEKIVEISQWGPLQLGNFSAYFYGCKNLVVTATDRLNTAGTTNWASAFRDAEKFNGAMNDWDMSKATDTNSMFANAKAFNQPIGNWDTSQVTNMDGMFYGASAFNQPIGNWKTGNVTGMHSMFAHAAAFDQPIGGWDTSKVTTMEAMFGNTDAFNQPIATWDTAKVTSVAGMFQFAQSFNRPLTPNEGKWNVGNVTTMQSMFLEAKSFNGSVAFWNTGKVTTMHGMFGNAVAFNQPISGWDVRNVLNLQSMFQGAKEFNSPFTGFTPLKAQTMKSMFSEAAKFNQSLQDWNTASVTDMSYMFLSATAFNQPFYTIEYSMNGDTVGRKQGSFNTENVTTLAHFLNNAKSFNQDLSYLKIGRVTDMTAMLGKPLTVGAVTLNIVMFNKLLNRWSRQNTKQSVPFGGGNSRFTDCYYKPSRSNLYQWERRCPEPVDEVRAGFTYLTPQDGAQGEPGRTRLINERKWVFETFENSFSTALPRVVVDKCGPTINPCRNANFKGETIPKDTDLSGMDFQGTDFSESSAVGVNFSRADLSHAKFNKAKVVDANFSKSNLEWSEFNQANAIGATFHDARLVFMFMIGADLSFAHFENCVLYYVAWDYANLSWTKLDGARGENVTMSMAKSDQNALLSQSLPTGQLASYVLAQMGSSGAGASADFSSFLATLTNMYSITRGAKEGKDAKQGKKTNKKRQKAMRMAKRITFPVNAPHASFRGATFINSDLSGIDLTHADLSNSRFLGSRLIATNLVKANLTGASFLGSDLSGSFIAAAKAKGADFRGAKLRGTLFFKVNASRAKFQQADLTKSGHVQTTTTRANFGKAKLGQAQFYKAKLSRAVFKRASLQRSIWLGSDISRANFGRARLQSSVLVDLKAARADFRKANLRNANTTKTRLDSAKLEGAKRGGRPVPYKA